MNVVFVNWDEADWFDPALRCAVANGQCGVVVVSDRPENKAGTLWQDIDSFKEEAHLAELLSFRNFPNADAFEGRCLVRWLIIAKLIQRGVISLPVLCLDRDEMLFSPMAEAVAPFREVDYACTYDGEISRAPILINKLEPLLAFGDFLKLLNSHEAPRLMKCNDMTLWMGATTAFGWSVGRLSEPVNETVFDNSLGCAQGCHFRDGGKVLAWHEKKPYFIRDGKFVRAHTVHCWGGFKKYMAEYAGKAGV